MEYVGFIGMESDWEDVLNEPSRMGEQAAEANFIALAEKWRCTIYKTKNQKKKSYQTTKTEVPEAIIFPHSE